MIRNKVFYAALATFASGAVVIAIGVGLSDLGLRGAIRGWIALLGFDFILALYAAFLSSYAARNKENDDDPRLEIAAIAFGTIAPIGVHALWVYLRSGDAGFSVSDASIVGAVMDAVYSDRAVVGYFGVLGGWALLSILLAFLGALDIRSAHSESGGKAYLLSLLLLVGSSLFLVPWSNEPVFPEQKLLEIFKWQVLLVAAIALFYAIALQRLRLAKAALRAAHRGAKIAVPIVSGIAIAFIVTLFITGLFGFVIWLGGLSGALFVAFRVIEFMLWLGLAAVVLLILVVGASWTVEKIRAFRVPPRWLSIASTSLPLLLLVAMLSLLVPRGSEIGSGGKDKPPPAATSISFQAVDIACSGLRWEFGATDRLSAPIANCAIYSDADVLIAIGTATPPGGPSNEYPRALQRGWTLAGAISAQAKRRNRELQVFVLSRGIEAAPVQVLTNEGPRVALLSGTVMPTGAKADAASVARALSKYLSENSDSGNYSMCDFYAYTGDSPGQPVQLKCSQGDWP